MNYVYGCRESTIRKYMHIIYMIHSYQNKLFDKYIYVPTGHRQVNKFCEIIGLPSVLCSINGTHIILSARP